MSGAAPQPSRAHPIDARLSARRGPKLTIATTRGQRLVRGAAQRPLRRSPARRSRSTCRPTARSEPAHSGTRGVHLDDCAPHRPSRLRTRRTRATEYRQFRCSSRARSAVPNRPSRGSGPETSATIAGPPCSPRTADGALHHVNPRHSATVRGQLGGQLTRASGGVDDRAQAVGRGLSVLCVRVPGLVLGWEPTMWLSLRLRLPGEPRR
jgi:hypothetical protein